MRISPLWMTSLSCHRKLHRKPSHCLRLLFSTTKLKAPMNLSRRSKTIGSLLNSGALSNTAMFLKKSEKLGFDTPGSSRTFSPLINLTALVIGRDAEQKKTTKKPKTQIRTLPVKENVL